MPKKCPSTINYSENIFYLGILSSVLRKGKSYQLSWKAATFLSFPVLKFNVNCYQISLMMELPSDNSSFIISGNFLVVITFRYLKEGGEHSGQVRRSVEWGDLIKNKIKVVSSLPGRLPAKSEK